MTSPAAITIRPFAAADAPALVDIYNQARPIEVARLTEDRFWSWFDDPDLVPERDVLVAEDEQGLVGLVAAFPWPNHLHEGYVFFVGPSVLPELRAKGIGRRLMERLRLEVVARYPGARLETRLSSANAEGHAYLTAGLGFTVERRFWQMAHPAPGKVAAGGAVEGVALEYLAPGGDATSAIATYQSILRGDTDLAAGRHLLSVDELAHRAGMGSFTKRSFQLARRGEEAVGLCFTSFPRGADYAQVDFLGVVPAERGRGLATAMLRRAIADAHAANRQSVRLEVSGDQEAPLALYRKLGFELVGGEAFYQRASDVSFVGDSTKT